MHSLPNAALGRPDRQSPLIGIFARIPKVAGVTVAVIGVVELLGWAFQTNTQTAASPGVLAMPPLAAASFVIAGISLLLAVGSSRTSVRDGIQQALAALVGTVALITLYEYTGAVGRGIDLLLFNKTLQRSMWDPPGRIAINSAGTLLLFALALLCIARDKRCRDYRTQMFALPGLMIPLVGLLGYVFGVRGMYALSQRSGMALLTVIAFLILGTGILFAHRERGVAFLLMDEGPAGVLTRRLLPAAVFFPVVLGLIRMVGEEAGLYETEFGVSLFAFSSIVTFVLLVVWSARVLRDTERERVQLLVLERQARATAEFALAEAETARADAERANTIKTDFLAVMSHELRTPLTAIMGYEELLSDGITGPVTELQRQQLGRINASARHLLGLIDEILTFARVDIGRERVRWEAVPINQTLSDSAALVEPMASAKRLTFSIEILPEDAIIQTDSTKLRQMLVNLLSNAIKFTDKGEVRLVAEISGGTLEMRIADTGVGIVAENIEHVFEPFWQAEQATTRKSGGTGLGLSVTRKLARLLGGDVTVTSAPGSGTLFLLTLPLLAPAGETIRRRDTPTTPIPVFSLTN